MRAGWLMAAGLAALVSGCGKPAETPAAAPAATETPAPEAAAPDATAPAAGAPMAVGTDLPADTTTPDQKAELEKAAAAAGVPATKQTRSSFKCDNDETIEVRFFPDQGIAVLVRGGQNVELQGEPVASGFLYTNGQTTLRGKGQELEMTVGMMAATKCTAITG
jgi:membrane-bound inhibitor of C-type lysozyme